MAGDNGPIYDKLNALQERVVTTEVKLEPLEQFKTRIEKAAIEEKLSAFEKFKARVEMAFITLAVGAMYILFMQMYGGNGG